MTQLDTSAPTSSPDAQPTSPRSVGHFIDGRLSGGGDTIARIAPGTGRVVTEVVAGTSADVDAAVASARSVFDAGDWSQAPATDRAKVLLKVADLIERDADRLARLDAEEGGKPIRLAAGDLAGAAQLTRYASGLALQMHGSTYTNAGPDFTGLILREPAGVAGLITPWNFPALILSQKLPFALAAGCTAVVKPSELTSSSAVALAQLYTEAGLPDGALNVVTGAGSTGQALAKHHDVDVLSFTGSTATGRRVMDAAKGNLKRLSLELGGKAANIVFDDADLADAAEGAVFGVFFNNGECCVSQARLLVHEAVADDLLAEIVARSEGLRVGQPLDPGTDIGAMIHEQHRDNVLASAQTAKAQGARIVTGGDRPTARELASGFYVNPTVIDGVTPRMDAFQNEIFGPVLTVTRFSTQEEAIALANDVQYGLANTVWSKNIDTALTVAKGLKSGTVFVNTTIDAPPTLPLGGYKASGVGREMGQAGFEEFTELKSVAIRTGSRAGTFALGGQPRPAAS